MTEMVDGGPVDHLVPYQPNHQTLTLPDHDFYQDLSATGILFQISDLFSINKNHLTESDNITL